MSQNILLHNLQSTWYVICNPFYIYYVLSFIHINTPPHTHIHTCSPQLAPSTMAIQKASVREVLRNIWPWTRTSLTSLWSRAPSRRTLYIIQIRECKEIINKLTSRDHFSCPLTFIPVMKLIFFSNLFQYDSFGSLSTNQKAEIWMLST